MQIKPLIRESYGSIAPFRGRRIAIATLVLLTLLVAATGSGAVQDAAEPASKPAMNEAAPGGPPDKSRYTLFNPTPPALMREFNTDRPSVTESPFTVDAGHFQAEFSFVEYTYDQDRGVRTDQFSAMPLDLRLGILNNVEIDLFLNPYLNTLIHGGHGPAVRAHGFGDAELRAKFNLWGNDGGATAAGVLPFVTFPTATGGVGAGHVQGGIILPLAVQLPAGFGLGTMAEFDVLRNAANDGYGVTFLHSITLGHSLLSDRMAAYIEYVGVSPIHTGQTYLAYFDTGITLTLTSNIQWDAGINLALSRHANDFTVFTGLSFRL